MGAALEFDPKEAEPALSGLSEALAALWSEKTGRELGLKMASPENLEDDALRALLPAEASAFGLDAEGAAALLLVIDRPGILALASASLGLDEEATATRLTSAEDYSPEETAAVEGLITAAQSLLQESLTTTLSPRALDHLKEATWASGSDPLDGRAMVVSRLSLSLAGSPEAQVFLILSPDAAAALKPATVAASTAAAADLDSLIFLGGKTDFGAKMLALAGGGLRSVDDVAALVKDFGSEAAGGAIVAVAKGEEHMLATIASLRDYPGCDSKAIVVILEEATHWNVVRCGRLGLFTVLGPDFQAQDLKKRLEPQSS